MLAHLNGATRVIYIVGDPIAQVKSPAGVTQALAARGRNAIVVPAHVRAADLRDWLAGVSRASNVDGIIMTVPHKFAAFDLCASASDRAMFLQAANTLRRCPDGAWHGDMFDGLGFVAAMRKTGRQPLGLRALLVGAGGAGTAIAHALVMAGVRELAVHDGDTARRDVLIQRLHGVNSVPVVAGSVDPHGFDLVLNATPAGMQPDDFLPVDTSRLAAHMHVGCVITVPAQTPLIAAARALECSTQTGGDMFVQVRDLMVDFLLGQDTQRAL
jgi:shikimate dehydrogenase